MADEFEGVKVLAPRAVARRMTRRNFLAGSAVAMFSGSVLLAACGNAETGGDSGPSASAGGEIEDQLNFFHWAEYDDPEVFKDFTKEFGTATKIDIYASNEEAIAKLVAAQGTSACETAGTDPYNFSRPTQSWVGASIRAGCARCPRACWPVPSTSRAGPGIPGAR